MWVEDAAKEHGLDCWEEGIIPLRTESVQLPSGEVVGPYWVACGEIIGAYRVMYKGSPTKALRGLIIGLQEHLENLIAAGCD